MKDTHQLNQQKSILLSLIDSMTHLVVQQGSDIDVISDELKNIFSLKDEINTKLYCPNYSQFSQSKN